jgi:hypothetical protein
MEDTLQITLDKLPQLLALLGGTADAAPDLNPLLGSYVIVRSRDSGVHAGTLAYHRDRHVRLTDARRLWYWVAAKEHTLSAVSLHGLKSDSKIASAVESIDVLDACEIIPCTDTAKASIQGAKSHEPR